MNGGGVILEETTPIRIEMGSDYAYNINKQNELDKKNFLLICLSFQLQLEGSPLV